jgi:nucleoside-diphosphate-sugar epimerase
MKIIVTGALGHIGSKLIRDLPVFFDDIEVIMIDNFHTQRYTSLFNLPQSTKYKFYEMDILSDNLDGIFHSANYVIHLAALTEASSSFENVKEYESVNYLGTKNILEASKKHSVKLIHFSSTSVYGTKKDLVDENCDSEDLNPQSPYAETKLKEESLVKKYFENSHVLSQTLRFGSICGISPGMRFHAAISKFCYQAALGKPITVWKTALDQKRPYLNLNDASKVIAFIIKKELFNGGVYNVVTSNFSVRQIINEIEKHIPNVKIELVENKIMNNFSYNVSAQKIINEGFEFSSSIENGIIDTLSLFKSIKL